MTSRTIAIIDDDHFLAEGIKRNIEHYTEYTCRICTTGKAALQYLHKHFVEIALIDLGLPDISGTQVITSLRELHPQTGQIILTKRSDLGSKLRMFDQGVDDYLPKPFTMMELLARIKALERRLHPTSPIGGERIRLTPKLWLYPGRLVYKGVRIPITLPHSTLLQTLWQARPGLVPLTQLSAQGLGGGTRGAVTTAVYRLKRILEKHHIPIRIVNVYNQGYSVEMLNTKSEIRNK